MKTLKMTKAGRDRIRALAAQCDISMGEMVETLSFAQVDDVIRCGATKARAQAAEAEAGLFIAAGGEAGGGEA